MDVTYRIVFAGQLADGVTREAATDALAKLFRKEPASLAPMFDGRRVVLRKGVPAADKDRFVAALTRAGLVVSAEAEKQVLELSDEVAAATDPKPSLSLAPVDETPAVPAVVPRPEAAPVVQAPKTSLSLSLEPTDEELQAEETSPAAAVAGAQGMMRCPSCGHEQARADICAACGIVVEKFLKRQAEKAAREAELAAAQTAASQPEEADNPYQPGTVAGTFSGYADPEFLGLGFDGRIGRVRFLAWSIGIGLVFMLGMMLSGVLGAATGGILMLLLVPLYIGALVYMLRLSALRLHDRNLTGWLAVLWIVPLVNFVFWIVLAVLPGDEGDNDYGAPPSPPTGLEKIGAIAYVVLTVVSMLVTFAAIGAAMQQVGDLAGTAGKMQELSEMNPEDMTAEDMFGFQEELIQEMEKSGAPPEMIEEMRAQLDEQRAQFEQMQADGAFEGAGEAGGYGGQYEEYEEGYEQYEAEPQTSY